MKTIIGVTKMRETKNLELKLEVSNTFLKTVSAFANFGEGMILFGVDDNGEVYGFKNPTQICLDIENRINDSILPKPDFELSVEDGNIVKLLVRKGMYAPYMYKGKAYRRSDTATIEVDREELKNLILTGSNLSFEELACKSHTLRFTILEDKMKETMGIKALSDDVLRTLGVVNGNGKYNNAAAILADENSFYGIDIARFGSSINEILDREIIENESILKQYDRAVEYYHRYYQYEEISGVVRKSVELVPETAFREAMANALIHRNWDSKSHVRIGMFKDCIEINSPGGLPNGLTEEEYLRGEISSLRNPILGNVFFRMHYIEMFGSGIRRIVDSYKDSILKPKFKITDNIISVSLPVLTKQYEVTTDEATIIECLQEGKNLASSEITKITGFSKAKTIRIINALIQKEYVKSVGNGRGTKYSLM